MVTVQQLSIFLENKSGRLTEVTEVLAQEGVNLSALCIAENADFGILRGIVSEPDKAYDALKRNHFAEVSKIIEPSDFTIYNLILSAYMTKN